MADRLPPVLFSAIIGTPKVRRALRARAEAIRTRAQAIAESDDAREPGPVPDFAVRQGTRPKGRPYAQVTSSDASTEFGGGKTVRRRYLGRAIDG